MDIGIVLVLGLIIAIIVIDVAVVGGSIDALAQSREAWDRAGLQRNRWVWQAFGVLCLPVALVYSGWYFVRIRPRVIAAARDLAIERRPARLPSIPVVAGGDGPQVDRLKIRMSWPAAMSLALPPVLGYALGFGMASAGTGFDGSPPWPRLAVWVSAALLIALLNTAFGVTLTPEDIVIRGIARRRIAWSDLVDITEEKKFGTRYVRLWPRTGRSRRLRAPLSQFGIGRRQFDRDLAIVEQWWLTRAFGAS